ncbi:MAG: hypothetical protein QW699_01805 [Metallosphaera sp.]
MDANPFISILKKKLDDKTSEIQDRLSKEYSLILDLKRKSIEEVRRKALKELPK